MTVNFTLDGRPVAVTPDLGLSLLEALRDHLGNTSPKAGCEIGRCGACVVLLDGRPVNACLVPSWRLDGSSVQTRDGIEPQLLEPVIAALKDEHAFQCGACAPGFVVTLAWLASQSPRPDADEAELLLAGHICRCSGYAGLSRAIRRLFPPARSGAAHLSGDAGSGIPARREA